MVPPRTPSFLVQGSIELRQFDAVTLDAFGTLVELEDPVPRLQARFGVDADAARRGLDAEIVYYRDHVLEGNDSASLAGLREHCAAVFAEAAGTTSDADAFQSCLVFTPLPGVVDALRRLRAQGLALAVVSNWDVGLHEHLRRLDLRFDAVVTSAEAGIRKPDPRIFALALVRLRIPPERALHIGDDEIDEQAARAAGLRFAYAPLKDLLA